MFLRSQGQELACQARHLPRQKYITLLTKSLQRRERQFSAIFCREQIAAAVLVVVRERRQRYLGHQSWRGMKFRVLVTFRRPPQRSASALNAS